MKTIAHVPPPQKTADRDPNEPAPESGKFLVTLRRPDGRVSYLHIPNEHYERVVDLALADPSIQKILPPAPESESSDSTTASSTTPRRA